MTVVSVRQGEDMSKNDINDSIKNYWIYLIVEQSWSIP